MIRVTELLTESTVITVTGFLTATVSIIVTEILTASTATTVTELLTATIGIIVTEILTASTATTVTELLTGGAAIIVTELLISILTNIATIRGIKFQLLKAGISIFNIIKECDAYIACTFTLAATSPKTVFYAVCYAQ
jgi:hypothetical protein